MKIRIYNQSEHSFRKNVGFMFVIYWGILVFWQNVSGAQTRGTIDTIIKIGLLAYFIGFYLRRAKVINIKIIPVFFLAFSLIITATGESQFSLSNVIAYAYPILFLSMVYGFGDGHEINRSQLVSFCNCVIGITLYAAIYAILFRWDQFAGALSLSAAYGSELCSFFISNHEYGMYLVAAIISCLLCLKYTLKINKKRKIIYIIAIALFSVNLILTFSRTSLLGLGIFLIVYCLFEKAKARKWIIMIAVAIIVIMTLSPTISTFVNNIVLKENNTAGRDVLFAQGVQYFQNGTLFEKIFGHGINAPRLYFESYYDHGSVHNGYLQVLLYYGLVGFISMSAFILHQVIVSIRFLKVDRHIGAISLALLLSAAAMMFTNTAIIFTSAIDSYFLTIFFIVVPKYLRNSARTKDFYGLQVRGEVR